MRYLPHTPVLPCPTTVATLLGRPPCDDELNSPAGKVRFGIALIATAAPSVAKFKNHERIKLSKFKPARAQAVQIGPTLQPHDLRVPWLAKFKSTNFFWRS